MVAIVVAKAKNGVIGRANDLPWHIPEDLKHFRQLTSGHTVIMGKNTYDSIYARLHGPLSGRKNIVVSRTLHKVAEGFELAGSLESAFKLSQEQAIYVIGGAQLYQTCLEQDMVDTIYVTEIDAEVKGDTHFPKLIKANWVERSRESQHNANWHYSFVVLERVR